jgi:tRNA-binding EMAP/Myf-like protein
MVDVNVDVSQYKVGKVVQVTEKTTKGSKPLKVCRVDIGQAENEITVVTSATNVREGSRYGMRCHFYCVLSFYVVSEFAFLSFFLFWNRVAVAPVGSTYIDETGEQATVQKALVGGVMSEGMLCDSKMLGWIGGAAGIAAQMPEALELGSAPPPQKPIPLMSTAAAAATESEIVPTVQVKPLFERKLTKEEKKKLAEEKRKARKSAKDAKKQTNDDDEEENAE